MMVRLQCRCGDLEPGEALQEGRPAVRSEADQRHRVLYARHQGLDQDRRLHGRDGYRYSGRKHAAIGCPGSAWPARRNGRSSAVGKLSRKTRLAQDHSRLPRSSLASAPYSFATTTTGIRTGYQKLTGWSCYPIPDHNTRAAALLSGQVDLIEAPPPDIIPRLQSAGMQIVSNQYPHIWPYILRVAGDATPFKDVRVRQAINLASTARGW